LFTVAHRATVGSSQMKVIETVRRTIRQHDLAGTRTRVIVALSGGADSVALLHLLSELDAAGELVVAGCAHFNHQLRDQASRDEEFCVALAAACDVPILVESEDVRTRADENGQSIEHAASAARHEFFRRALTHFEAERIAVGHTRDDQAETFLLRLLRGAGSRGLAAMHPRNGDVIRPLLACRRADLAAYLEQRGIAHVEDETNADVAIPRNRVRAELLPLLQERFNPNVVDVLADQAELARQEWLWMEAELELRNLEPGTLEHGTLFLEVSALELASVALRRFAVWKAMTRLAGARPVSFDHVEAVRQLMAEKTSTPAIDGPGQTVQRIGARLVLTKRAARNSRAQLAAAFRYPLPVPGEVRVVEAGCVVAAKYAGERGADAIRAASGNRGVAVVAGNFGADALSIRNRRPGDRFSPPGLAGRKKLQDFLVDRKVPRAARDGVPLVVDRDDRIVWVAGHEIDRAFRVTDASQTVVILTLRQV
jgi:tRNA(Ile)-lysidine synthase